jgi:hypothetical protein
VRHNQNPVSAYPLGDGFVAPVLYGGGSQWVRNVIANDGFVLRTKGRDFILARPEIIAPSQALAVTCQSVGTRLLGDGRHGGLLVHRSREGASTPKNEPVGAYPANWTSPRSSLFPPSQRGPAPPSSSTVSLQDGPPGRDVTLTVLAPAATAFAISFWRRRKERLRKRERRGDVGLDGGRRLREVSERVVQTSARLRPSVRALGPRRIEEVVDQVEGSPDPIGIPRRGREERPLELVRHDRSEVVQRLVATHQQRQASDSRASSTR